MGERGVGEEHLVERSRRVLRLAAEKQSLCRMRERPPRCRGRERETERERERDREKLTEFELEWESETGSE